MPDVDVRNLIRQARHITIVGHVAPDGDVVGSMLGLGLALTRSGKRCALVSPDPIPDMFRFLPGVRDVHVAPPSLDPTDLIIVLDATDPRRIGSVYEAGSELFRNVPVLAIDHHVRSSFPCTCALIDTSASAVAEQVFELLAHLELPVDPAVATCLLTGLVSDTQCFRTSNTSARSLRTAAALVESGAVLSWIVDWLYRTHPITKLVLWGRVLSSLRRTGRVIWSSVPMSVLDECGAKQDETEGLIDILAGVPQAEVAVLFKEMPDRSVKASLRAIGDVNVAEVARRFDGGGHPKAAGFTTRCSLDEIEFAVVRQINEILSGSSLV